MNNDLGKIGIGIVIGFALALVTYLILSRTDYKPKDPHTNTTTMKAHIFGGPYERLEIDSTSKTIQPKKETTYHKKDDDNILIFIPDVVDSGYTLQSNYPGVSRITVDTSMAFTTTPRTPIYYGKDFVYKYPTAPKFLYGKFSRDSIQLDLQSPDGKVVSRIFQIDAANFTYETQDGKVLSFKPAEAKQRLYDQVIEAPKPYETESNLYVTYDAIQKTGRVRLDYSLMFKNKGLYISNQLQTRFPIYSAEVGLRIKLK